MAVVACAAIPAILLLNAGAGEYAERFGLERRRAGGDPYLRRRRAGRCPQAPSNPIGWLLLGNGLMLGVCGGFPTSYAGYAFEHPGTIPGGRLAALWDTVVVAPPVRRRGCDRLRLPRRAAPSPRWRPIVFGGAVAFAVTLVGGLLSGRHSEDPFRSVCAAGGAAGPSDRAMQGLGMLGMFATLVAAVVAVVSRFRGSEGELRLQMKWVAYAATLIPVTIVVGTLDGGDGPATTLSIMAL